MLKKQKGRPLSPNKGQGTGTWTIFWLDWCPQADGGGEQVLINDERLLIIRKLIKLRKFLMDDYSKKLGEMFGGMDYYS